MDPILDDLKQLLEEQKKSEAAVASADKTLADSQAALNQAKAGSNDVTQRLTPVQQLANDLDASHAALEKQRKYVGSETEEAEKFYDEVFPVVEKEVDPEKRAALEKIEADIAKLEVANSALRQELEDAKAAKKSAQAKGAAADALVRESSGQLRGLGNQIQSSRQRVSALLSAARKAFASRHAGETLVQTRDLHVQAIELRELADPKKEKKLQDEVEKAHQEAKAATLDVTEKAAALVKVEKDSAAAEAELQSKRREEADARAAFAAGKPK
jgi:chromosome segregation ATPase